MATAFPTTASRGAEDVYQPTPISSSFSILLRDVARYVEAERDIETVDIWDPAFRAWLTQAEDAQTRVAIRLSEIKRSVIMRSADKPLLRMALLIDGMMGSEDRMTLQRFLDLREGFVGLFRCSGPGATEQRVDSMLVTAAQRIDALVSLDIHAGSDSPVRRAALDPVQADGLTPGALTV